MIRNREVLRQSYIPPTFEERHGEMERLAVLLSPALEGLAPPNTLILGPVGSGKTTLARFVGQELQKAAASKGAPLSFIYLNCGLVDTQYRVLTQIANHFIEEWNERLPFTGWPTDAVYEKLKEKLDAKDGACVIVLDEVDKLVLWSGGDVLFNLTRLKEELSRAKLSIICIARDAKFMEYLEPRVKTPLREEEIVLDPYDASALCRILEHRARVAFKDGALAPDVIPLCAGIAAQEKGDARGALDLLRVAAEIAERGAHQTVNKPHVNKAQAKIESDRVNEVVRTLPTQSKLVLLAALDTERPTARAASTGDVYTTYRQLCEQAHVDVLTQRRVTDLISELDMLGVLQARVVSKGRFGRTKEIQSRVPVAETRSVLLEDPVISSVATRPPPQTTLTELEAQAG